MSRFNSGLFTQIGYILKYVTYIWNHFSSCFGYKILIRNCSVTGSRWCRHRLLVVARSPANTQLEAPTAVRDVLADLNNPQLAYPTHVRSGVLRFTCRTIAARIETSDRG
jgi:hypothetical protein